MPKSTTVIITSLSFRPFVTTDRDPEVARYGAMYAAATYGASACVIGPDGEYIAVEGPITHQRPSVTKREAA
jgi:hypothetical protein